MMTRIMTVGLVFPFVVVLLSVWVNISGGQNQWGVQSPCPDDIYDDDLPGFDFIPKFGIDRKPSNLAGVKKIVGTNKYQTAFSISENANLRIPTTRLFPYGIPPQFSFVATLRMTGNTHKEKWDLVRIEDPDRDAQFGITINGEKQEVELYMADFENNGKSLQSITFRGQEEITKMFDNKWHNIHFGITDDEVVLYIDCQPVATSDMEPRGPIDTNGEIVIGAKDDGTTATFDLQWMSMHCDPTKPQKEKCADIVYTKKKKVPTATLR